jgi:hypothetical protein
MPKNLWAKAKKVVDPQYREAYLTVTSDVAPGWTWYVLKAYQCRAAEKANKYARWLCRVVTPMTGEWGDVGDVYVSRVPLSAENFQVLFERERLEGEAKGGKA